MKSKRGIKAAVILTGALISATALADTVIPDDHVVQGSSCVGLDCVNNENFGFDTLRLKENNTRIKFDDTSTGAFPANDWQITANDSTTTGINRLSIEDVTRGAMPFTIQAGAPSHSLFVDSSGRLGLGTMQPVLDLHFLRANTPAIRLDQTNAGGFTAQTWDIAGNEANFFVRDVTGGSKLPFRIRPGAPTSSIDIAASGNVGIGTASPGKSLEIFDNEGATLRLSSGSASDKKWDLAVDKDTGNLSLGREGGGGRIDINGQLVVNGRGLTPDYVFEPGYELMSIDEHAAAMRRDKHLPHVQAAQSKAGVTSVDVGARQQEMLEELEIAHLYIATLNERLAKLEASVKRLEKRK